MNNANSLKQNIFYRAKVFIESIGEFAPFGAKISHEEVKDIVYYDDSEIVDSSKAVQILEADILDDFKMCKIQGAAIAFDVSADFKNADGVSEKRDALCLKLTTDGKDWSEEYFPYMIIDGECVWR